MPTLPKPTEGGDFTPPPAGSFPGIAYRLIDLGTQQTTYKNETKEQHKILLSFELKDDDCLMPDGRPMTIHQRYTWSMHEKANLRKQLEQWRGKKFTDNDFGPGGFDVRKLLRVPAMLSIVHNESGGKTYANIAAISKLPKQLKVGELENDVVFLWIDPTEWDEEVFKALPEGIQDTIKKSPEYHEMMQGGSGAETRAASRLVDDEVPFEFEWRG